MKKIILFYNEEKKRARDIVPRLTTWLAQKGLQVVNGNNLKRKVSDCLAAVALGGDGTMLKAARRIAPLHIPLFGVNLGSLGFLAEMDWNHFYPVLNDVIAGKYLEEKRCLLDVSIRKKPKTKQTVIAHSALNDCVIRSCGNARVIQLDVWVGKSHLTEYISDGLIIATPTGSTAYSLASSGPIVHPSVGVFIITPICPHTLAQRPIIVSAQETIRVRVKELSRKDSVIVSIDGQINCDVYHGSEIIIKRSKHDLRLILNPQENYFSILRKKMGWGKR